MSDRVVRHQLVPRTLSVERVEALGPRMNRIVLHGAAMEGFASLAPTDHIKLGVPGPDGALHQRSDGRPVTRDYTVRRVEPDRITVDIAIHGAGHVSDWASRAEVGDSVLVLGPRGSRLMPPAEEYLLAGDMASLPVIARWLEDRDPSVPARVYVAVDDAGDEVPLAVGAIDRVTWVHAGHVPVPAERLADVIDDAWRPGMYAWAAGEVLAMRRVRDRLVELGFPEEARDVGGYWRRGQSDFDHHQALDDD